MIPSTGSGSGVGGHGMHNGCLELEKRGKLPFKAIFQQLAKYFCTPIMKSFVLQIQGGFWTRKEVRVDWIHEILRVVDCAVDVSTPIKGVVCPPQVSVDTHTCTYFCFG